MSYQTNLFNHHHLPPHITEKYNKNIYHRKENHIEKLIKKKCIISPLSIKLFNIIKYYVLVLQFIINTYVPCSTA